MQQYNAGRRTVCSRKALENPDNAVQVKESIHTLFCTAILRD